MTVAKLGYEIDSSPMATATAAHEKFVSSAAKVEQAATRVSGAGTRMSRGFADLNPVLDKIVGSLGRLEGIATSIDKRLDMMAQAAGRASKANQVLDRSAIEASTAYKQLEASLNAVTAAQRKGDASLATSLSAIEKQREAIARLNAELQKLRTAPSVPGGGRPSPANNNFGNQGNVGNIAAQGFDVATTAAFMPWQAVAIQQGPQFAQAFAGQSSKQAIASMGAGLAAIVSPISLVAIGLTGAAAAAISYGVSALTASDDTKKLEDAMERHDGIMKRLEERYGSLIDKVKGYGAESTRMLSIEAGSDIRGLRNANKITGEDFFSGIGTQTRGGYVADNSMFGSGFMAFNEAITKLRNEFKAGRPDFEAFYDSIYKTAQTDPEYAKKADELAKLVAQFREGSRALEEMERIQRRLFDDIGPNGMLLSQGATNRDDAGNLALFNSRQAVAAQRQSQGFDAQIYGIGARTPQERAEAARRTAAAQYDDSETGTQRKTRIEQAGILALTQAEKQLSEAQRDRAINLDKIIQDQQSEIDLIGKTGGAATALRKEYELTSQLRLEAARQGIDVDQKELDLIKERAAALGELTDRYNQSKFTFEMNQQAGDARLSPRDRQITTTLRQYGLPEDLKGTNASQIGQQLDWSESKDMFKGFFSSFEAAAWENGGKIGDALGKAALNSLQKTTEKLWDNIFDRLATGLADVLMGARGGNAGSGVGGAIGSVAAALGGRTANDNFKSVGATKTGIGLSQIATSGGLTAKVASDYAPRFQGLLNDLDKAGYKVSSLGEGGYSYRNVAGSKNLSKHSFGEALDINPRQNPWSNTFKTDLPANVNDLAKQNGLTWGGTWNKPDTMHFQVDKTATMASDAVNKLADSAGAATKGLDTMAGGLGKLGQSMSTSFFPAAPSAPSGGGGGMFSWLGGLFGGGADLSKYKGGIGLYADGTNYAPGGMAVVGERGPELVDLPQGSKVFNTNKSAQMMAGAGNDNGGGVAGIRVFVDQDGNWQAKVESIAARTSQRSNQAGLADQQVQMRRGGFGDMQRRYANQKG